MDILDTNDLYLKQLISQVEPNRVSEFNPSYVISKNAAGYTVKIEMTIGSTTYTTNITPYDGDTVATQTKTVSVWI